MIVVLIWVLELRVLRGGGVVEARIDACLLSVGHGQRVTFGSFTPEELEEASVAGAHVICAHRGALEAFDGLVD